MKKPLISIVTITYNAAVHVRDCLASVRDQTCTEWEHIAVDGQSTDGTVDILRAHGNQFSHWLSEPDTGIADAMNKGLRLCTGEWVLFLHADDYLLHANVLAQVAPLLRQTDAAICACGIEYLRTATGTPQRRPARPWNARICFKQPLWHQGVFCRRGVFAQTGAFDTQFKIAMDYDFFLRCWLQGHTVQRLPLLLTCMRDTGISSRQDWPSLRQRFLEEQRAQHKNCRHPLMRSVHWLYWRLYWPYRRLLYGFSTKNM